MVRTRYVALLVAVTVVLAVTLAISLQSSDDGDAEPQWLFALTTTSGSIRHDSDDEFTLTIHDSESARSIAFTDRPDRLVAHYSFVELLKNWDAFFADDPPNAALVMEDDRGSISTVVVELSDPQVTDDVLTFSARDIESESADFFTPDVDASPTPLADVEFTNASLFIDQLVCFGGWLPDPAHCWDDGNPPPPPTTPSRSCWGGWFGDLYCTDGTGRNQTPAGTTTDSG